MNNIKALLSKNISVFILPLLFVVSIAVAQDLTPEQYINLEISVRTITLEEVKERATGNETGTDYKQLVKEQYQQYGISAGSHLKYGNKNKQAVAQWLESNPSKQVEMDNLTSEFNRLIQISN